MGTQGNRAGTILPGWYSGKGDIALNGDQSARTQRPCDHARNAAIFSDIVKVSGGESVTSLWR